MTQELPSRFTQPPATNSVTLGLYISSLTICRSLVSTVMGKPPSSLASAREVEPSSMKITSWGASMVSALAAMRAFSA